MFRAQIAARTASIVLSVFAAGCAARAKATTVPDVARFDAIRRASVWTATDVATMNMRTGRGGPGSFDANALVECVYVEKDLSGNTPKFTCALPTGEQLKVKYGAANGEVYAEVAATRLLWALGYGADDVYPVRVRCQGCPADERKSAGAAPQPGSQSSTTPQAQPDTAPQPQPGTAPTAQSGTLPQDRVRYYEFAAIERRWPGRELEGRRGPGWDWAELDLVDPASGGAPVEQRDALKLLAVLLQHTDSKREQQRIVCLDESAATPAGCQRPFMLINDLGKTFGKANAFNRDASGSVNLEAWRNVQVWADDRGCRARLAKSVTGTLDNPVISEGGRAFLAERLNRLTDAQLHDLFTVARFPSRQGPDMDDGEAREVGAWVAAFKDKAAQVQARTCATQARAE